MDKKLIEKYREYANSDEAFAVLFVKKYLEKSKGKWIDIVNYSNSKYYYVNDLEFKFLICVLYDKKIQPKYPPIMNFYNNGKFDERSYKETCRAITWETAHRDISEQKANYIKGISYKIEGVKFNKNKNSNFFIEEAPQEIKDLEKNINDRTNPLWDIAFKYVSKPKYIFKIKLITKLG